MKKMHLERALVNFHSKSLISPPFCVYASLLAKDLPSEIGQGSKDYNRIEIHYWMTFAPE